MLEGMFAGEHFEYHHPQCVAIRFHRRPTILETELLWIKAFWTHPPRRITELR